MELRIAERKQAEIKLGLQGPSGSGKTYSALLLAFGLCNNWSKIAVIDTENHSADLYAHLGRYNVLNLSEPFTHENYIKAIEACEKAYMQVIIIDSISQEWEGSGGIIETHSKMAGNSFTHNTFQDFPIVGSCCIFLIVVLRWFFSTLNLKEPLRIDSANSIPQKFMGDGFLFDSHPTLS